MKTIKELEATLKKMSKEFPMFRFRHTKGRIEALKDVLGLIEVRIKNCSNKDDCPICDELEELKKRITG